jgi:small GTP-binding protein
MNSKARRSIDFKAVVLGASFVGKTSIIARYCENKFDRDQLSTIGGGFTAHTIEFDDVEVNLQLCDTAGQERFRAITPAYVRGANGAVLVYDLTVASTFNDLNFFYDMFLGNANIPEGAIVPVMLLGNKSDLGENVMEDVALAEWMTERKVKFHYRVSAMNGEGIAEGFREWVRATINTPEFRQRPALEIPVPAGKESGCC